MIRRAIVTCWSLCLFVVLATPARAQDQDLSGLMGGKATEAELRDTAKQIVDQVAKLRQLDKKRAVQMSVQSKAEIRKYVEKRLAEEIKPDELKGQEDALKRLGLLPPDYPLQERMVALYEEQIAGYYDPFEKKFFIADWIPLVMQAPIMAHELTHALQDQHYDLRPYLSPIKDNSDATTARQAVVEGDAVLTMMAFTMSAAGLDIGSVGALSGTIRMSLEASAGQYPVFASAPMYLRESLIFPYATGADFAVAQQRTGGWKQLNKVYRSLPESTEQVIHPEKYLKDPPTPVSLSGVEKAVPRDWKPIHTDVLGEFGMQMMLVKLGAAGVEAAAGWDGDRYRAFRNGKGETLVFHRSTWDTEKDAQEFEAALQKYSSTLGTAGVTIERKKKDVVWVIGPGPEQIDRKLVKAAWK